MIKLKELIELQSMVYTETIKPKHKQRFTRPTPSFHENIIMPRYQPPANDSSTTLNEVKYLGSLKPNEELVLKYEEVEDVYKPYAEELGIGEYVDKILHESVKWIMTLKYDYNRPRPFQIAEFYNINLNGTQTDSMKTPSFPSGHAVQGYLIADVLSKHNPSNTTLYKEVGESIAHSRVIGKAHYPSDKKYGKKIADALFKGLK